MSETETQTNSAGKSEFIPQPGRRIALVNDQTSGEVYLVGPEDYMHAQGSGLLDRVLAGEDMIFNMTCGQSPDLYTALLVRLQTDYAGWAGLRQVERWLDS